jgi:uncharacterized protein (TIGR01777 family)
MGISAKSGFSDELNKLPPMQNILITGGSGLIGQRITDLLEKKGYQVSWLGRTAHAGQKTFLWNIEKQEIDSDAVEWADAIVHLAGAGIAEKRWTPERKKLILESRTHSARLLFSALEKAKKRPNAFISASAVGYYGLDTGTTLIDEFSSPGSDFLAEVVKAWENEAKKMESLDIRTVMLRTGIVLAAEGGALAEILKPPIAAPLGSGDQWMSWIHIDDLARMYTFALEKTTLQGVYNAVAPNPATNQQLTQEAAYAKGKTYIGFGVPGFLLRLMLGEMAEMVLGGNRVSCQKIQKAGFQFEFYELSAALKDLFHN